MASNIDTSNPYTEPDFAQSALITIDTQNDFTLPGAPACIPGTLEVIPNMVKLLKHYRQQGWPIIHIVRLYQADGSNVDSCRRHDVEQGLQMVLPNSEGAELVSDLKPSPDTTLDSEQLLSGKVQTIGEQESVIYKPRWGMFYRTPMSALLQQLDCNTLVFCGCNYPNCPRTSIYEASERDYRVVVVADAVSGITEKDEQELTNIGVTLKTTAEVIERA